MIRAAHTPGAWECDTAAQPIIVNGPEDSEGGNVICTIEDSTCKHGAHQYHPEIAAANARLIAAAPDLLHACETLAEDCRMALSGEWDKGDDGFQASLELLESVIGKAIGGTP